VTGDYYRDFPTCAVVAPFFVDGKRHPHAEVIETALASHGGGRLDRVIGPREREQRARALGLDMATPTDAMVLARHDRCPYLLTAEPWGSDSVYVVFWSQSRLGLELKLVRAKDGAMLWRSRHVAKRSDGGLPISPLSALWSMATAAALTADSDVDDSLANDAVRRMMRTLPDASGPATGARAVVRNDGGSRPLR